MKHRAPFYLAILFVGLLVTQALVLVSIKAYHWLHP